MKIRIEPWLRFAVAMSLVLGTAGCGTIARENVLSHINTGFGATLTENPQTQLYEVKLGFIRTQSYSVPTGKTIVKEKGPDGETAKVAEGSPADVPELVSGIRVESGIKHLFLGANITESFALGSTAVNSPAAVAMYVATARNDAAATNAANAARDVAEAAERARTEFREGRIVAVDLESEIETVLDGIQTHEEFAYAVNAARRAQLIDPEDKTGLLERFTRDNWGETRSEAIAELKAYLMVSGDSVLQAKDFLRRVR